MGDLEVIIEKNAGLSSNFLDETYEQAGATIQDDCAALFSSADILVNIQTPPKKIYKTCLREVFLLARLPLPEALLLSAS